MQIYIIIFQLRQTLQRIFDRSGFSDDNDDDDDDDDDDDVGLRKKKLNESGLTYIWHANLYYYISATPDFRENLRQSCVF